MIICFQLIVSDLVRKMPPFRAILVGIAVSAAGLAVMGLRPSLWTAAAGILVFAVGEMMYSAHFYHYMGNIAPPEKVGMYMGFAFLPIALGSFIAGQIGGPIARYFRETVQRPEWMWFAFAGVGLVSALGLAIPGRLLREPRSR